MLGLTGIAVQANADGRLELVAIAGNSIGEVRAPDGSGGVWHASQQAPGGGWSGWQPLDAPGGGVSGNAPALARNATGSLETVVVADDGTVAYRAQAAAGGPDWTAWESLRPLAGLACATPVLAQGTDRSLSVFVMQYSDMTVWQASHQPGASWSDWTPLGSPPGVTRLDPLGMAAAANADGRLEVFASDTTAVWHRWQEQPGGTWSDWFSLGTPEGLAGTYMPRLGTLVVAGDADGQLFVFVLPSDGAVRYRQQNPHFTGGWEPWQRLTVSWFADLGVGLDAGNRMLIIAPSQERRLWQREMFTAFWSSFGASTFENPGQLNRPVLARDADGHLELFLIRDWPGPLYHLTQTPGTWPPQWSEGKEWPSPQ